jgi:hypothetical protein
LSTYFGAMCARRDRERFKSAFTLTVRARRPARARRKEISSMARYGKKAQSKVKKAMHERKTGTLKIGLSEARKAGGKVPSKKSSSRKRKSSSS